MSVPVTSFLKASLWSRIRKQLPGEKVMAEEKPWALISEVVANGGVGIDHLDVPYINSLGVKVTNTPGVVSNATADIGMALLLASARKVVEGHQVAMDPKITHIPQSLMGVEVSESTLGIIGMGHIGYKIAQRGKGFDMKILYHNRSRRSVEDEQAVGATYCANMDDLLKESDFVMLAVNLTPETTRLIGHRQLSLMKPTATLVNVSRGLVVDQDALVKALQSGTIRAAALDVTYPEPLPRDHPLLGLPNVLITPHVGTHTLATTIKMVQQMVDNAVAAVKGQTAPNEPAVAVGNVGQLAVDLIVSTLNMSRVGHIHTDCLIPMAGNNPYATCKEDAEELHTPAEVYTAAELKLAVLQIRAPIVQTKSKKFRQLLVSWIKASGFSRTVVLSSSHAYQRDDQQLQGTPLRYLATPSLLKVSADALKELGWREMERVSAFPGLTDANTEPRLHIPGGGITKGLYTDSCTEDLSLAVLLLFCSEGDNIPDAFTLVNHLNDWLHLLDNHSPEPNKWKIPPSWNLLFGSGIPPALF
uniref:Glyoxylate reductase/hydroxypyruvate reductase n=1 Tax=Acanthochromis polyacanthus TaxID=80966 RepID=A0A3Q1GUF9_9TELE